MDEVKPELAFAHAACRRGSDKVTEGQSCSNTTVELLSPQGSPTVRMRCTLCNFAWNVALGGTFTTPFG